MNALHVEVNKSQFDSVKFITGSKNNNQIIVSSKDFVEDYDKFLSPKLRKLIEYKNIRYVIFCLT